MPRFTSRLAEIAPPLNTHFLEQDFCSCEAILLLQAALECGIFDILGEAALTSGELATALGGDPQKTAAFLDALAALACLEKTGESYRLSPAAGLYLRRDSAHSICELLQSRFSRLKQLQQAGRKLLQPAAAEEEREQDAAEAFRFTRIMAQSAVSSGSIRSAVRRIARDPAFGRARRMLDLGCSHGLYAAALCLLNRDLQAVLFDRTGVLQLTRRYLERYRLGCRVEYRGGDFNTDPLGEGYDLVFASNVFYRSPELVIPVLEKIRQSLKPGGLFYLQHRYLNRDRSSPAPAALYYCTRILLSPSFYVATLPEAVAGLQQAGFTVTSICRSRRTGNTLLRARR
jgi:SAM-dependent methyltransferase